jgi:uncharacterized protein (DUF736 family)
MKQLFKALLIVILIISYSCTTQEKKEEITMSSIQQASIDNVVNQLKEKFPEAEAFRIEKGAKQVAMFWNEQDGSEEDYLQFCLNNFVAAGDDQKVLFEKTFKKF